MTLPHAPSFRRTFDSLSIYNYRVFWIGQLISISGTWMQSTAQAWLVLKLTNSPFALGTVTVLQFLPITLLTLFGGVLADRLPKRLVVLTTQSVAAVQALVMAFLVYTGTVQLWEIYVLALLLGVINAFDNPTRQAFVADMVGPDHLQNAIALNSSLFNAARIVGPAIAGLVIAVFGVSQAFLFNGLSFAPVIIALLMIKPEQLYDVVKPKRGTVFKQLAAGVRYAVSTREVLLILSVMAVLGTFGYNFTTILPLIARYVLHAPAVVFGALTSAVGLGSLIAALGVASAGRTSLRVLLGAAAVFSIVLMTIGLSTSLPLTLVLLVVLGIASIIFSASANTRLQLTTPPDLRGRVMSLYFLLFAGTTPIGSFLVGVLSERVGVPATIVLFGIACLLGVAGASVFAFKGRAATPARTVSTSKITTTSDAPVVATTSTTGASRLSRTP